MDETVMTNVGQWNSDLVVIWAACFFSPFIICCIARIVVHIVGVVDIPMARNNTIYTVTDDQVSEEGETSEFELNTTITLSQPAPVSREDQWKIIEDAAMEKAMSGDKAARDWVTKHVFTDPVNPSTSQHDFMQEVVDALRPMGYKVSDIKSTVNELTRSKDYTSADELIQDVIRNS